MLRDLSSSQTTCSPSRKRKARTLDPQSETIPRGSLGSLVSSGLGETTGTPKDTNTNKLKKATRRNIQSREGNLTDSQGTVLTNGTSEFESDCVSFTIGSVSDLYGTSLNQDGDSMEVLSNGDALVHKTDSGVNSEDTMGMGRDGLSLGIPPEDVIHVTKRKRPNGDNKKPPSKRQVNCNNSPVLAIREKDPEAVATQSLLSVSPVDINQSDIIINDSDTDTTEHEDDSETPKRISYADAKPLNITAKDVEGTAFLWANTQSTHRKKDNLCCFYWLLVACIFLMISFTIWLSIQLAHRQKMALLRKQAHLKDNNPFTFDDIFNSSLKYRSFSVNWINGEDIYVYREDGNLLSYDIAANTTEVLVDSSIFDQVGASRYYVSNDRRYILLAYEVTSLWRHSFLAKYKIYDRLGKSRNALIDFPNDPALVNTPLQHAGWAPTGPGLAFISGNNVYYQPDPDSPAQQVTTSGQDKFIFNGIADWLYEEEILGTHVANWWSSDGGHLCYANFNDTNVPLFKFPYYGPKTNVYGDLIEIAYPKAGDLTPDANTKASLYVVDTSNLQQTHVMLQPPVELANVDHYFIQVSWRDVSTVSVVWANRPQNHSITTICDITTGACLENTDLTQIGGWIDPTPYIEQIENGQAYLTILPQPVVSAGMWRHLAYITSQVGVEGQITFLTDGEQEIKSIAGFEAERNLVYYISTNGDPRARHLFRIGTPLADVSFQTPVCLTCSLAPDCQYVSASFSSSGRYYVSSCRGPAIPRYTLEATQTTLGLVLEDNADIKANLDEKTLPAKEYMQIPIGGGYMAWAEVFVPPAALEPGNEETFPLLVQTYAGPGSQSVDWRFDTGLETYLASTENIVYARLDGRGTASRGDDFRFLVYRKLGTMEIDDQLLGGSYLRDNLAYVDATKTAIWGWSYGGFATSHAVANETNVYRCGIIGAALSDRRYYDTAHTERFMGRATPDDNEAGYIGTDVMNKIELFKNKSVLIVHGTADDNVHFASSVQLVKALTDAEIQFRIQLYPDQNHYFSSSSRHLYRLYTNFLLNDCWSVARNPKVTYKKINISETRKLKP